MIPSGVTHDADDGGGNSGVSMIVANHAEPLTHTPVSNYANLLDPASRKFVE
jgi:hypothetical protein